MRPDAEAWFCAAAVACAPLMRRVAYGLCGDWHLTEDLVQQSLMKAYVAWPPRDEGAVPAYLNRILVRTWIDQSRRGWWRFERLTDQVPEVATVGTADGHDREPLLAALHRLPARQRACVFLRYLQDWSVEDTARALGCTPGTVKSQSARGLTALRLTLETAAASAAASDLSA